MTCDYNRNEQVPTSISSLGILLEIIRDFDLVEDVATCLMRNAFAITFPVEMYLPFTADDQEALITTGDRFSRFMTESAIGQMNPMIVTGPKTKLFLIIAFEKKADAAIFRMQFLTR